MIHYAKFSLFHMLTLTTVAAMLLGNDWIPLAYLFITAFIVLGDAFLGDDTTTPDYRYPGLLTFQLYLALPLLILLMFVSLWAVSDVDHFGLGRQLSDIAGYDLLASRQLTEDWHFVIAIFFIGLMVSTVGTVTGHELVHRTWDSTSVTIGRWLLAFSFDANFSVEHVYGHHKHVATSVDPATAPRGRSVYRHIILSTIKGNISAWNIEKQRLLRKKHRLLSFHNVCLRGYGMSLILLGLAFWMAGLTGLLFFTACGLWAKVMLEMTNYMEHYGLVRTAKSRVEPRHSWNTNRRISSWAMFNLSRHSHHHAHGQLPFHKLQPYPQAPQMFSGYLSTLLVTLVPPLWYKMMAPRLAYWDEHLASPEERRIVAELSRK